MGRAEQFSQDGQKGGWDFKVILRQAEVGGIFIRDRPAGSLPATPKRFAVASGWGGTVTRLSEQQLDRGHCIDGKNQVGPFLYDAADAEP